MSEHQAGDQRDNAYAWVVVICLTLAYTVSYIDRQVLNLMVDPIKHHFGATDTQMSLLQGAAFIFAYVTFTPIFGRFTDAGVRKYIIAGAVVTWSAFSALCGYAHNLETLFIARAGVGAAEAALAPAAFSMISDYFTKERLPRALSIFSIGPYLGGGFALILGGLLITSAAWVSDVIPALSSYAPWQITFIVVGAAGIPLGVLLLLLREPPRRIIASAAALDERRFTLKDTLAFFWKRRGFYLRFNFAMALTVVVFYTLPAWMPALLSRNYNTDPREVGLVYGSVVLIMGTLGVLTGPIVEAWLRKRGHKSAVVMCIIMSAIGLAIVCTALAFSSGYTMTLVIAAIAAFLYSFPQPIAATALQLATPNRMRGVVFSIYVLTVSGLGLGVAPTLVALLTDYVFRNDANVIYSLSIVCTASAALAVMLGLGTLRPFREAVEEEESAAEDTPGIASGPTGESAEPSPRAAH